MGAVKFMSTNETQACEWFAVHVSESEYDLFALVTVCIVGA